MEKNQEKGANTISSEDTMLRSLEDSPKMKNPKKLILIGLLIIIAGTLTGMMLSKNKGIGTPGGSSPLDTGSKKIVGSKDTSVFKDMAEGQLELGGIDGEGTHKLIRPGGDSQTVYITSTVLDLEQFVGKKIRVWGQTHAAQKAGWLMDVGRVEVLE